MIYTFEFVGVSGRVAHLDLGVFADDREARRAAEAALLDHATAVRVEVWSDDRPIMRVERAAGRDIGGVDAPSLPAARASD